MPKATSSGGSFTPIQAGTHLGICYGVIDIGTQPQHGNFPSRRKVLLAFELPHVRGDFEIDGKMQNRARVISTNFTLSTDKKANLRKQLASWRGKDFTEEEAKEFDLAKVCGHAALLSIVHKPSADGAKTYANIASIMKPMQGTVVPPLENPKVVFDIPEKGPVNIPESLPEWIVNLIEQSEEYTDITNPEGATSQPSNGFEGGYKQSEQLDEDVPF